jgi:hypothetical protein
MQRETREIAVTANRRHQGYVTLKGRRDETGSLVTRNGMRWVGC